MEDLPLGRVAVLVTEFAVKDLALGRTLMMMICGSKGNIDFPWRETLLLSIKCRLKLICKIQSGTSRPTMQSVMH